MLSLWHVWELSDTTSCPWRSSRTLSLLRDTHFCPFILGSSRVEQWTSRAVRDSAHTLMPLWCWTLSDFHCVNVPVLAGWLSARLQGPSKCPQWALSQRTRPPFPSWMFHQLLVPGQATGIASYSIIRLETPPVMLYPRSYVTVHSVIIVVFTSKTLCENNGVTEESLHSFFYFTGPWVGITTRPSRPAGLSPPKVKVLGPDSLQVRVP